MYKAIHLIVNPVSGPRRMDALLGRLAARAARRGLEFAVHATRAAGHGIELARDLTAPGSLVVAVGGDGTIGEVVAGMADRPGHLCVLPVGTENLLAKQFGFRCTEHAFWSAIDFGRPMEIDVGACNARPFVSIVGVGFDGLAVQLLDRVRRGHITHFNYTRPLVKALFAYAYLPIRVIADGERFFEGPGLAYVGNIPRYAIGLKILRDAEPNDGWLDLCVFPCRNHLDLAGHAIRVLRRRHLDNHDVRFKRCRDVRIEADAPIPVQCDGDVADPLPIHVRLTGHRVTLLVPPPE